MRTAAERLAARTRELLGGGSLGRYCLTSEPSPQGLAPASGDPVIDMVAGLVHAAQA